MTQTIIRHDTGPMGWSVFGGSPRGYRRLASITVLSAPDAGGQGMHLTLVGAGNPTGGPVLFDVAGEALSAGQVLDNGGAGWAIGALAVSAIPSGCAVALDWQ